MKIIISGTTGVGKSTTTHGLAEELKKIGKEVVIVEEKVSKSQWLQLYFEDINKYGFFAQQSFLLTRLKQLINIERERKAHPDKIFIFDRYIFEDKIFQSLKIIQNNFTKEQLKNLDGMYQEALNMLEGFKDTDFTFIVKADFKTVKARMIKRGRKEEINFDENYWKDLYWRYYNDGEYIKPFKEYSKKFAVVDTTDLDPKGVVDTMIKYIKKRSNKI